MANPFRENKLLKIADMVDIPEDLRKSAPDHIRDLTVRDLDDLAQKLMGVPTFNPNIDDVSIEDLGKLEELFKGYKDLKLDNLSGVESVGAIEDLEKLCDESCCCCTPCCCCAAVDVHPIEHGRRVPQRI
jgi:hypothetical protein